MEKKELFELVKNGSGSSDYGGAEFEKSVRRRGDMVAVAIGAVVCTILVIIKLLVNRKFDFGVFTILFVIYGVQRVLDWRASRRVSRLIIGIVFLFLAAIFILLYIGEVIGL